MNEASNTPPGKVADLAEPLVNCSPDRPFLKADKWTVAALETSYRNLGAALAEYDDYLRFTVGMLGSLSVDTVTIGLSDSLLADSSRECCDRRRCLGEGFQPCFRRFSVASG